MREVCGQAKVEGGMKKMSRDGADRVLLRVVALSASCIDSTEYHILRRYAAKVYRLT